MNERCASLAQRDDARSIFDREEVEPAPDTPFAALAHRFKIGPSQMTDLDLDFENRSASRALEFGSRCLICAFRTMQIINNSHMDFLPGSEAEDLARSRSRSQFGEPVRRSMSLRDFSSSPSRSATSNPTARAPSRMAMQSITRSRVSFGGGSSG
jgi:hypothetical protein